MNNKIIIEIFVPQLESSYDVFIPINITIHDVIKLVINSISEITNGGFTGDSKMRLYEKTTGEAIEYNLIVKNSNLRNGSKVILI